ncbi:MAG: cupin domain-containing protein [Crocinitomicaceae bacterium]|nr:cupin domain-containing protein [Crocinitomicaceae bacterium]
MNDHIEKLIKHFNLLEHPEGGYYTEVYRSPIDIPSRDRQLMTSIYFLLRSQDVSHFHRIKSDELWFFHSGSPLIVHTLDSEGHKEHLLGMDMEKGQAPQVLVKAETIFGSTVSDPDSYSLVSCAVAPGFDFRDFELFKTNELLEAYPDEEEIIRRLT